MFFNKNIDASSDRQERSKKAMEADEALAKLLLEEEKVAEEKRR